MISNGQGASLNQLMVTTTTTTIITEKQFDPTNKLKLSLLTN